MIGILRRLLHRSGNAEPGWIDADNLRSRLANGAATLVLDVRQPEEYAAPPGHLPGAINIPLAELASRIAELSVPKRPIVVVCQTDRRSARAASELCAAGIGDVAVLRGGTAGWHQRGLPLE